MKFFVYVTRVLPKLDLRSRETPKSWEHVLRMCERVIAQKHGNAIRHRQLFAHDRNIACAIAIVTKRPLTRETNVRRVQLVTQTVIPGVKTPKLGIGLGHRRIPNLRQDEVESKKFLTSKSWGHIESQ